MQINNMPDSVHPRKHIPRKVTTILSTIFLLVGLLFLLYLLLPKTASRNAGLSTYNGLIISEVMAANAAAVPDENGEFHDWIELYNGTGSDLNLEDVMLTNRSDSIAFHFPPYVLKEGHRGVVFASGSYQRDVTKPFHGNFRISSVGDHIYLYTPGMELIDELITPTMRANTSYICMGISDDGSKNYEITDTYSPAYENSPEGFEFYRSAGLVIDLGLCINEVCPDPRLGIPDEDEEIVDWVELYNSTSVPISLKGYHLSDKENKPMKWQFPDNAHVPANGYYKSQFSAIGNR